MTTTRTRAPAPAVAGIDLGSLIPSWERSLRSEKKSPRTIRSYGDGVRQFVAFLGERGMPTAIESIAREHIEAFIVHVLDNWKPATAATRYRDVQQFFRWAKDDDEITRNPMENMKPPKLDDVVPPHIRHEDIVALFDVCKGRAFDDRRDTAIIMTFVDTGARLAEIAGATLDDLDLDNNELLVTRKGRRDRKQPLPLAANAVRTLDKYLRARRGHRAAYLDALWIGTQGAMTRSGIAQMVKRRCREAGIDEINVHRFRHTWAHMGKAKGLSDEYLATVGGWRSPAMLARYGRSAATERAKDVHLRLSPGDDFKI